MTPYNKQKLGFALKYAIGMAGILFGAKLIHTNAYDIGCVETMHNLHGITYDKNTETDPEDESEEDL